MIKIQKMNFTIVGVVGLIIILAILLLYPRRQVLLPSSDSASQEITTREAINKWNESSFFLTVTSPADQTTVATNSIVIKGTTAPGADVFVNELDTKADAQGNFSVIYPLEEDENYLVIGANDENGNFDEKELTVIYEP